MRSCTMLQDLNPITECESAPLTDNFLSARHNIRANHRSTFRQRNGRIIMNIAACQDVSEI